MADPIRELLSQTSYAADGATTVWNFSFAGGYLEQDHVKAQTYNPVTGARADISLVPANFVGPYQVSITPAVAAGLELTIYRDTPKDLPIVNFADKGNLSEQTLDINAKQSIFVAAETVDALGTSLTDVGTIVQETAANALAAQAAAIQASADAAAAAASAAQADADAVKRVDLAAPTGSELMSTQLSITGSPTKKVSQRFDEWVTFAALGADVTGNTDISAVLLRARDFALAHRGINIAAQPSDILRLDPRVDLNASNFRVEMNGARQTGPGRIWFNGDSGIPGDRSKMLENISFRGGRFGGPGASQAFTPAFYYCKNSVMEDIDRQGYGDTAINMYMCQNTHFRRFHTRGGKDSGSGSIAALMLLSDDSTCEDFVATEGPFIFGVQIKGGRNSHAIRCRLIDVHPGSVIAMTYGMYLRGDAPWGASPTAGLTYPWADLGWSVPDPRRAAIDCTYQDCFSIDSPAVFWAFDAQEFQGGGWRNCGALMTSGGAPGFSVSKLPGGQEKDFDVIDCWHENAGASAGHGFAFLSNDASKLTGIKFRGGGSTKAGYRGVTTSRVEFDEFSNVVVEDAAQSGNATYLDAFRFELDSAVPLTNNVARDTRTIPVHASGFAADASTPRITPIGNQVTGFAVRPYAFAASVNWADGNSTPFKRTTTNGVGDTAGFIFTPPAGSRVYAEFLVVGKDSAGVAGIWRIAGLFANDAGTVTQVGATVQVMTAINPGAWTGPTLQVVGNSVRLVPTGKAATTIEWTGKVLMQSA